jgi:predicted acylesterase/phospholipase RssA
MARSPKIGLALSGGAARGMAHIGVFNAMQYEKIRLATKSADIVITPDVSSIGMFAFYKVDDAIAQGYKATKKILPKLHELIHCP